MDSLEEYHVVSKEKLWKVQDRYILIVMEYLGVACDWKSKGKSKLGKNWSCWNAQRSEIGLCLQIVIMEAGDDVEDNYRVKIMKLK